MFGCFGLLIICKNTLFILSDHIEYVQITKLARYMIYQDLSRANPTDQCVIHLFSWRDENLFFFKTYFHF